MSKTILLTPTNYSKTQTLNEFLNKLIQYPQQGVNTPAAFEHSVEFVTGPGSSVGTLAEYQQTEPCDFYVLKFSDGEITVFPHNDVFLISNMTTFF
jgi:hypothetical protein